MKLTNCVLLKEALEALSVLPDNSVDLILTDPPNDISKKDYPSIHHWTHDGSGDKVWRKWKRYFGSWDEFSSRKDFWSFTFGWIAECHRVLKPTGNFVSFFPFHGISVEYWYWESLGGHPTDFLCWHKSNPQPRLRKTDLMRAFELAFWGSKEKSHFFNWRLGQHHNVFESAVNFGKRYHPNQKPVVVLEQIVDYLCPLPGLVLDPFCGSGSTLIAAKKTGRSYLGFDFDKEYVKISRERLEEIEIRFPRLK